MKPISSVACCALLGVLATIGCSGGDSATAPPSDVDFSAGKPRTYEATLLPLPQSATSSKAAAINAKGQIVGLVGGKAVRWDQGALPVELGIFPGHESSYPIGISDDGDVLGAGVPPQIEPHIDSHVLRWPASGGIEDLGEMCCDAISSAAISGKGEVAWVGWVSGAIQGLPALHLLRHGTLTSFEVPEEGFSLGLRVVINDHSTVGAGELVWSSHAGWTPLVSAYNNPGTVEITDINNRGDIVAEDVIVEDSKGTLYPSKGTPVPLEADFIPTSINDFGVITGRTAEGEARLRYPDGTIVGLPTPSGFGAGPVSLSFTDINDAGIVVGTVLGPIGGVQVQRAAIWRPVPGSH